jgi:hypothetical protein
MMPPLPPRAGGAPRGERVAALGRWCVSKKRGVLKRNGRHHPWGACMLFSDRVLAGLLGVWKEGAFGAIGEGVEGAEGEGGQCLLARAQDGCKTVLRRDEFAVEVQLNLFGRSLGEMGRGGGGALIASR